MSSETSSSDINLLLEFTLNGDAKTGWTTREDYPVQYCTARHFDSIKAGGSPAVTLASNSSGSCTNAWVSYPICEYKINAAGRMESTCDVSRNFTYSGAKQLNVGMPYTFTVGFNVWKDNSSGSTLKPLASGTSVDMAWILIEGASSLALSAVAAVLMTLTF
jgi:hypothetical protein